MTTTTDTRDTLTPTDLAPFDDSSTELIRALEAEGWRGRVSSRGHAIMRAPDGTTTTSVSRDHDKNRRTRQNAWAEFHRWQAAKAATPPPTPEDAPMATVLVCPTCQATFPDAKALGAHMNTSHEPMRPAHLCPECGDVYWSSQALSLHLVKKHPDSDALPPADPTPCTEDGCPYVGRSRQALTQHLRAVHSDGVCPLCGAKVRVANLARHLGHMHTEAERAAVLAMPTVVVHATEKAPELPPAEVAPAEDRNVVLDYLVEVTTGKDAEAMVAAIRAVVAPPLVDEVRRLREHNSKLEAELDTATTALGEANAKLSIMREAMGL